MLKKLLPLFLIAVLGAAVYSNTLEAEFQFDDLKQITENYRLWELSRLDILWSEINSRFLTYLTFSLNYYFHRLDVTGYHVTNLVIHVAAGVLVYWLTLLLFQTPRMKDQAVSVYAPTLALFSALIFLTHPLQTQAVTYLVQRAASLAALFYLAALTLYVYARLHRHRGSRIAAIAVTYLAMFTKQTAFTLPAAIVLTEYIFFPPKNENSSGRGRTLLPFMGALLVIPFDAVHEAVSGGKGLDLLAKETVAISRTDYLLTQFRVIRTYLRLLFFPVRQNLDYDYPVSHGFFEHGTWAAFLTLAVLFGTGIAVFRKQRILAFGIFWFFLTLSVESSLIPIRDVIFEHRVYLPMFGFALAVPYLLRRALKNDAVWRAGLVLIVCVLSVLTYQRNEVWKDGVRLWTDVITKSPNKARPYGNLAFHYNQRQEYDQAILNAGKAVQLEPEMASAYTTLSVAYGSLGRLDQEIEYALKALELDPAKKAKEYNNVGSAYGKKGDLQTAIAYFQKGLERDPRYPGNYLNLGFAYVQAGKADEAISVLTRALEVDPYSAEAYNYLGIAYGSKGQFEKTVEFCQKAVRLKPDYDDAYNNLGVGLENLGRLDEARKAYLKALEINPQYSRAKANLAKMKN